MIRRYYLFILLVINIGLLRGLEFIKSPPSVLTVAESIDIVLNCTTDITSTITWFYQQVDTGPQYEIDNGETLRIPNVGISYEGLYFCEARDDLGVVIESKKANLKVAYIKDQFVRGPSQVYTIEGSTVEFACTPPQSYPDATITWEMDQKEYTNSRSYITENYTLVIVGILPEDSGNYQCVATNPVSGTRKTSLEGELYVTQIPDKGDGGEDNSVAPVKSIESYREVIEEGDSASFLCGFQGVPYPLYSWYHPNGSQVVGSDVFSFQYKMQVLQITSVTRAMSGVYTCQGDNVAGVNHINVTLFVNYTEPLRFVTTPPKTVTVKVGEELELRCTVQGSPPISIRWMEGSSLLALGSNLTLNTSSPLNSTVQCVASNPFENITTIIDIIIIDDDEQATNSTEEDGTTEGATNSTEGTDESGEQGLNEVHADVLCTATQMILSIKDTKRNFSNLHLLDSDCKATQNDSQYFLIAPLKGCGTLNYFNETHIVYKNQVIEPEDTDGKTISRSASLQVAFECAYPREGSTTPIEWDARGMVNVVVKGVGSFSFKLDMYTNSSFTEKIAKTQYPFQVIVQDELYLEVTLDSPDPSLALHISDAVASNSPVFDPESDQQYDIIKDGCKADPTLEFLPSPDIKTKRFTIKAFKFLAGLPVVYLHAFLRVCNVSEELSNCSPACGINRRKRSVESLSNEKYHVYQGPFIPGIHYSEQLSSVQPCQTNLALALLLIAFYFS